MAANSTNNPVLRTDKITFIAILSLVNGIINILWALGVSIGAAVSIIGLCAIPLTILPAVLGGFEIAYAAHLLSNPPIPCKPNSTIAILDILCILQGNFISLVAGIILLVFYHDLEIVQWFSDLSQPVKPEV